MHGSHVHVVVPNVSVHSPSQILTSFLESLIKPQAEDVDGSDDDELGEKSPEPGGKFIARYLKWLQWQRQRVQQAAAADEPSTSDGGSQQAALCWQLVERTRRHPRYGQLYRLPSYCRGWAWVKKRAPPGGVPRMFALDCEMVETETDSSCLVGLCLVDETGSAVYKALVKPEGRVTDYRTWLTGLDASHLEVKSKRTSGSPVAGWEAA